MEIRYTRDHEWVAVEGGVATVGITDHAQRALGDVVFIQLPTIGAALAQRAVAAVVESVKAASDIFAPLTGSVVAVNDATVNEPSLINTEPLGAGWLFKMRIDNPLELDELLDEQAYVEFAA